jgi:hypothetical protein
MRVAMLGMAWYRREDYPRLLGIFADRANLHEAYDDWLKAAERGLDTFRSQGQAFQKVYIDPDTFPAWCAEMGLNIDSKARVRFANEAVGGVHRQE